MKNKLSGLQIISIKVQKNIVCGGGTSTSSYIKENSFQNMVRLLSASSYVGDSTEWCRITIISL